MKAPLYIISVRMESSHRCPIADYKEAQERLKWFDVVALDCQTRKLTRSSEEAMKLQVAQLGHQEVNYSSWDGWEPRPSRVIGNSKVMVESVPPPSTLFEFVDTTILDQLWGGKTIFYTGTKAWDSSLCLYNLWKRFECYSCLKNCGFYPNIPPSEFLSKSYYEAYNHDRQAYVDRLHVLLHS